MYDGFVKVAMCTPRVTPAEPVSNGEEVISCLEQAIQCHAQVVLFPELCLTGYTCGDLFFQKSLLKGALEALAMVTRATEGLDALVFVGLPLEKDGKLYNVAAALQDGQLLGFVPKRNIPNYNEFYELRHFLPGPEGISVYALPEEYEELGFEGPEVPFGGKLLFVCQELPELVVGAEICEDLWAPENPGTALALAGATLLVNLSASNELVGKAEYRRELVRMTSARLHCAYAYASSGEGESTQDLVFSGARLMAENGQLLAEGEPFAEGITVTEADVEKLVFERRKNTGFVTKEVDEYMRVPFHLVLRQTELTRRISPCPFVPADAREKDRQLSRVLELQARGLAGRLRAIGCERVVVGVSGGLDSTLAMLVCARAFDELELEREKIIAVTMPGFGTTKRTKGNAELLAEGLGATLKEISIAEACRVHFKDIGLPEGGRSVAYENAQARERTQVLMDLANMENALVVGTGDLSELALGWATYNGDHMSMYGVNAGVPKTLIRHLVDYYARNIAGEGLSRTLLDILDTPVSPELLPPEEGEISQKTEELVGPYALHDFFLYYMLRYGFAPGKIYRLAMEAFAEEEEFTEEVILKWLRNFYKRFFASQFKRSCLPDGPKVGAIALSPRGDLRMPSDAGAALWLKEVEELE